MTLSSCSGWGSWLWIGREDDFEEVGFASVEALEPLGAFFERDDGGDEGLHVDGTGGHPLDGLRVLTGGGARALQADLPRHNFLQRKVHVGCDVADEKDRPAFA